MTIDQIIALAASIGACLAAIATFLTVRQMAKQRTEQYYPELVISRVYFDGTPEGEGGLPSVWIPIRDNSKTRFPSNRPFAVDLNNIGIGAAKNVEVVWKFPLKDLVQEINSLAEVLGESLRCSFENEALSVDQGITSFWRNQHTLNIDYVLPASVQSDSTPLTLPHAYTLAVSAFVYLLCRTSKSEHWSKIPTLAAEINHSDIADRKHATSFDIELEIVMLSASKFTAIIQAKKRST